MIKRVKRLLVILAAAVLAELVVFNYPWLEWHFSSHAAQRDLKESMVITGGTEDPKGIYIHPGEEVQILVPIHETLDSLYLNITEDEMSSVNVDIEASDDGFFTLDFLGSVRLDAGVESCRWNRIHAFGTVQELNLKLTGGTEGCLHIWDLLANVPAELHFCLLRLLVLVLLGLLACHLFSASAWQVLYIEKKPRHKLVIAAVLTAEILAVFYLSWIERPRIEKFDNVIGVGAQKEYQQLAESLLHGRLTINSAEKPDWSAFMDRPYDRSARLAYSEYNEDLYFDTCYYNGNYYVYFGIVPVLLFYLPFRLLTGQDLSNYWPNLLCWLVTLLAIARMADLVIRKRFPKTSFITAVLLMAVLPVSMGCLLLIQRFSVYELPSSTGIMLASVGLCFWLDARRENGTLCCARAAAGSLCLALVAGCRPPQALLLLTGFFLFGWVLVQNGKICVQRHVKEILSLCVPVILVAALLMAYNFARFGSPFDFGEKYNLTVCNLNLKAHSMKEALSGIFLQLFQPPVLRAEFPFVTPANVSMDYLGYQFQMSTDPLCGGAFMLCPVLVFLFLALFLKKKETGSHAAEKMMIGLLILLAVVLCGYEATSAGYLARYRVDSMLLLAVGLLFAVPLLEEHFSEGFGAILWNRALAVLTFVSLLLSLFAFFNAFELIEYNPKVWYAFKNFFQPW